MVVADGQPFLQGKHSVSAGWKRKGWHFFAKRPFSTNHLEKEGNGRLCGPAERSHFIRTAPEILVIPLIRSCSAALSYIMGLKSASWGSIPFHPSLGIQILTINLLNTIQQNTIIAQLWEGGRVCFFFSSHYQFKPLK